MNSPRFPSAPAARPSPALSVQPSPETSVKKPAAFSHKVGLGLLLVLYGFLSLRHIARPGLQYDEAYAASQALKMMDPAAPLELSYGGKALPVGDRVLFLRSDRFHGPLRAYLSALWFQAVPVQTETFRLLGVLMGAAGLLMVFALGARWFSPMAGLLAVLLLVVDPTFIFLIRNDSHFNGVGLCIRLACLVVFARLWEGAPWRRDGWKLTLLLLLGLWNHVEFSWFAMGGIGAAVVAGRSRWRSVLRERAWLGWVVLPLVLWGAFFGVVQALSPDPLFSNLLRRLAQVVADFRVDEAAKRLRLIGNTLNGNWVETFYLGRSLANTWTPLWELFSAAVLSFLAARPPHGEAGWEGRQARRSFLLYLIFFILTFLVLTPPVYSGDHVWEVYPFLHLFAAAALWEFFSAARAPARWALAGLLVFYLGGSVRAVGLFHARLAAGEAHPAWAPAINQLAADLGSAGRPVVCLDWGFSHNLAVLSRGRLAIQEPYCDPKQGFFTQGHESLWKGILSDPGRLYVAHSPDRSLHRAGRDSFMEIARSLGKTPRLRQVYLHEGKPCYEVYEAP